MMEEKPEILDGSNRVITPNDWVFRAEIPKAILEFRSNGEIYHHGKLIELDKDKIEVLKEFILSHMWKI